MNPGYLSLLLLSITFILCASGWKDVILRGISHKYIHLFFALWLIGLWIYIPLFPRADLNGAYVVLALYAFGTFASAKSGQSLVYGFSAVLLMGAFYALFSQLHHLPQIITLHHVQYDNALLCGAAAALLFRKPREQVAAITLSLMLGDGLMQWLAPSIPNGTLLFGSPAFYDLWWVTVTVSRLLSIATERAVGGCRTLIEAVWARRK